MNPSTLASFLRLLLYQNLIEESMLLHLTFSPQPTPVRIWSSPLYRNLSCGYDWGSPSHQTPFHSLSHQHLTHLVPFFFCQIFSSLGLSKTKTKTVLVFFPTWWVTVLVSSADSSFLLHISKYWHVPGFNPDSSPFPLSYVYLSISLLTKICAFD